MNIIFDIDDTITNETEFMIKYAPIYLKKKYNLDVYVVNPNGYGVSEVFGLEEVFKNNGFVGDMATQLKKIDQSFWNKYFMKYMFYPIKKDAAKTISELRSRGYKINFVSLRGKKDKEQETIKEKLIRTKIIPFLTKIQLKRNHIKYDRLILVEKNEDKIQIAKELNASIIFDDNVQVLEKADNMIPICIETPHNTLTNFKNDNVIKIPFSFESIKSLIEDYEKRKILIKSPKRKIKKLKIYKKMFTETVYTLLRNCGKEKVVKKFNPIVIGEENLPKLKGPNLFVSNHRNIKDPLITIAILENPTHFAALKRMFDYKENMFGHVGKNCGTYATTLLVKSMGCLPIARPTDDNYMKINMDSFKKIKEYLADDTSVAIYPEGTLNRDPITSGNLLPLKSNQTFKVARNGSAIIRPVAIVWVPDNIKIKNRVLIAFLKPIYTRGLSVEEVSEMWKNAVNEAIDAMNKIIDELNNDHEADYLCENEKVKQLINQVKTL